MIISEIEPYINSLYCCWLCNKVGDIFWAHFVLLSTKSHFLNIIADYVLIQFPRVTILQLLDVLFLQHSWTKCMPRFHPPQSSVTWWWGNSANWFRSDGEKSYLKVAGCYLFRTGPGHPRFNCYLQQDEASSCHKAQIISSCFQWVRPV